MTCEPRLPAARRHKDRHSFKRPPCCCRWCHLCRSQLCCHTSDEHSMPTNAHTEWRWTGQSSSFSTDICTCTPWPVLCDRKQVPSQPCRRGLPGSQGLDRDMMGRPTAAVSSDFDVFVCSECSPERLHRRGNLKFTSPNCVEVGSATEIGERLRAAWEKYVFAEAVNDTPHAAKSSSRLGLRRRRSDKMMKRRGSPRGFRCVAQMMVEDQHPKASGEGGEKLLQPFCFAQDSPVQVRCGVAVSGQLAGIDVCDGIMLNAAWNVGSALSRGPNTYSQSCVAAYELQNFSTIFLLCVFILMGECWGV